MVVVYKTRKPIRLTASRGGASHGVSNHCTAETDRLFHWRKGEWMKTEALQKLGDFMATEERDTTYKGARCQNKEDGCNHYVAAHLKGGGPCLARKKVEGGWIPLCKCKEVKRVVL